MATATLLTSVFFLTIFLFGWQIARWVLVENRIERLLALSGVFGIGLYIFFLNVAGYFMPIQTAFYVVFFIFLFLVIGSLFECRFHIASHQRHLEWGIDEKWRKILLAFALFLTVSVGIISIGHPMDMFTLREPTAMTIVEGNFPPKEIWSPENPLLYHYAPELFSAAVHKLTGLPIYLAYDFQIAVLSGSLFLLGFILINSFFPSVFVAFWSAILMLYSGSLIFLEGLNGVPALIDTYILKRGVSVSFKFVTDAIGTDFGLPVINYVIQVHWGAMAFALMIAVIYMYFHLLKNECGGSRWPALILTGLMLALLALVAESFFVILSSVIFGFPFLLFMSSRYRKTIKKVFLISFFILLISAPIAVFQGGVLKSAIYQQLHLPSAENENQIMLYTSNEPNLKLLKIGSPLFFDDKSVFGIDFLAKWLLLIGILSCASIFLFKQCYKLAVFLLPLTLLFFMTPLVFDSDFPFIKGNLGRFFYPVSLLGGLVAGLFLASLYTRADKKLIKRALVFLTVILMAQGLWTHFIWLSFGNPPGQQNKDSAYFAQEGTLEANAYKWVKENTTIDDIFLIIRDEYSECGFSGAPNCLFILNTGRMAPIFRYHQAVRINGKEASYKIDQFEILSKNCDSGLLTDLGFTHIYVDEHWPDGIEAKCLKNNELDIIYEGGNEDHFPRVYSIKNSRLN